MSLFNRDQPQLFRPTSNQGPVVLLLVTLLVLLLVMLTLLVTLLTLATHRQDERHNQTGTENLPKASAPMLPPSTLSKESTEHLSRLE